MNELAKESGKKEQKENPKQKINKFNKTRKELNLKHDGC